MFHIITRDAMLSLKHFIENLRFFDTMRAGHFSAEWPNPEFIIVCSLKRRP